MKSASESAQIAGARKAAIFLLCLEQEAAAEVLGKLSREQVEQITLAIANTTHATREEQESVLNEFKEAFAARPLMQPGGPATARELLERTLDRNDVEPVTQRLEEQIRSGPFAFLVNHHPDDIRLLLETEHPQTVAVVAAQLSPELSARVLAGLAVETQSDVLSRIARLGSTDSELLEEIAGLLRERIGRSLVRNGGIARAAEVLRESTQSTSRTVLQSIKSHDAKLAVSLRESLFTFNDLSKFDQSTLKLVLEKTEHCSWSVALKGASEPLRNHIFASMQPILVQALQEEIRSSGPVRLSEITSVQQKIADIVMSLIADEIIELPRQQRPHLDAA